MSQWNNSYAYNNQYQGANNWNGDADSQYMNTAYYQNPNNQYVSFNEFLSQMQTTTAAPNAANYNLQYQNYPANQYDYQNMASSSQNTQPESYNYGESSKNAQPESYNYSGSSKNTQPESYNYDGSSKNMQPESYNYCGSSIIPNKVSTQVFPSPSQVPEQNTVNEVVLKSNLTATASEFVPKSSIKPSYSHQNIQKESNNAQNGVKETKSSHASSSDKNWRERPTSSQQNSARQKDSYRNNETNKYESNNYRNQDSNSYNRESSNRNYESSGRNHENNRSNEPNGRNYESNHYENSNRGQKNSSKSRNKDSDRTFYNSSVNKSSQDVRGRGEGSGRKNWGGSQRLRAGERNYADDEQFASSYLQYRDEAGGNQDEKCGDRERRSDQGRERRNDQDRERRDQERERRDQERERRSDQQKERRGDFDRERRGDQDRDRRGDQDKDRRGDQDRARRVDQDRERRSDLNREKRDQDRDRRADQDRDRRPDYDRDRRGDQERDRRGDHDRERHERKSDVSSPVRSKNRSINQPMNKEMTQRERLSEQLDKGTLECLVCCERVRQIDSVWYCSNCYHVLHLRCIRKWALSSIVESKWRCPACQNTSEEIPSEYRCMCGGVKSPEYQRGGSGAHTCGRACRRPRACDHPCPLVCHPGPCPPCRATILRQCGCGAETRSLICSDKTPQVCARQCGRALNCGVHTCTATCHEGDCEPCGETRTQVCYCKAEKSRTVACTAETSLEDRWCCGDACSLVLPCGAHSCRRPCHAPPCAPCELRPAAVLTCPCGKTRLDPDSRKKCTDPVPLCGNICAKPLACGPAGDKHFCKESCHEGECPTCPDKTLVQCRCGHSSREVPCGDLPTLAGGVQCQKKCNKKLSCGRHRCRSTCCANSTHRCTVVCGRALSCQLHRCEEFCHTGHCAPCPIQSFDELRCECGAQVLYPPVRCGAKPPPCNQPCRRPRPCGHPPHHACHPGACPPCVVLTARMCHGNHEERKTIPCSQEEFSCGLPCGKPLSCGKHTCIKICHKGPCDTEKCTQPCNEKRPSCGHPCAAPCHRAGAACPAAAACRRPVRATCPCGRRAQDRACADNARDRARIMSALAATKMQEGGSVDLSDVQRPGALLKTLECDDECRQEARARQLALALQIRNPDVSAKLAPRYSDFLRTTATKEPSFAQQIHDKLTELVQLAKKSKQKTRAHSFPSMNWQKRQFIHELCEHFGCESVAYDAEPNRNVVATADREKSWLPAMSVLEVVSREAGKRRVPGPMLRNAGGAAAPAVKSSASATATSSGWSTLTSSNAWAARSQARATTATAEASGNTAQPSTASNTAAAPKIDYFDNPPE